MSMAFWFLIGQTVTGLPAMSPGTDVKIVLPDLVTVLAAAEVEEGKLIFKAELEPGREVRLLISHSSDGELHVPVASISPEGNDIMVYFEESKEPVSFRTWLEEEREIKLLFEEP